MIEPGIGVLTEEERDNSFVCLCGRLSRQFIDDAAHQHCLALAGIALDPEELSGIVVSPPLEVFVVQNPSVRVLEKTTLRLLNPPLFHGQVDPSGVVKTSVAIRFVVVVNFVVVSPWQEKRPKR